MPTQHSVDIVVRNEGTIVLFEPLTQDAREWFDEHVASEGYQWFGGALAVEHRYAVALRDGLIDAGFTLAGRDA